LYRGFVGMQLTEIIQEKNLHERTTKLDGASSTIYNYN
jgi:hypothetical protein